MGSKTPANKEKRDISCEACNLKFQTLQALRSHRNAKHSEIATSVAKDSEAGTLPASRPTATPNPATTAPVPTSRVSKRLQLKKGDVDTDQSEITECPNIGDTTNKIHFVCPKCFKVFSMYFQAYKHIQKKHCVDTLGNKVSPDSPNMIKPVRVETCTKCKQQVDSLHKCSSAPEVERANTFFCLGCDEQFLSVGAMNSHVSHSHHNNVDSMFFKTQEEFNIWKQRMESQVRIKYLTLNHLRTQKFYQCNYVSPRNEANKTYLCPSQVSSKVLATGIQIHYYKEHFGHTCPEYEIPKEFSHCLTSKKVVKNAFDVLIQKEPDDDLYLKFKKLMHNITNDAGKVTTTHLQKLFDSALKIQALLNSYDEDHDKEAPLISKSITDDQIADALEYKRTSARLKRKSETRVSVDVKKKKVDKTDSDNLHPKSKKDENDNKTVTSKDNDHKTVTSKENKQFESPKASPRSSAGLQSPSFNDSYKQFIGTTETTQETAKKNIKNTKRKEIVKTKMGQFSPKKKSPNVYEVIETPKSKPNTKTSSNVDEEVVTPKSKPNTKKSNVDEVVVTPPPQSKPNTKKSSNVEVVVETPKSKPNAKKSSKVDEVFETPKSKPNILKPSKINTSSSAVKNIIYEVREQENDCNILVLKI